MTLLLLALGDVEVLLEVVSKRKYRNGRRLAVSSMHVSIRPAPPRGRRRQVPVELRDERADLQSVVRGEAGRVDAGPGDHDHA
jgi:hypothetical protein